MSKLSQEILCNIKYSYLKTTDYLEIRALIDFFYYRGNYNLSGHAVKILFSETMDLPLFSAVMSKNRFEFLVSNLPFDDSTTRKQRWSRDRFAAFREVFELFNNNCAQYVAPIIYMSLDETLCPIRNQIGFKQYNPDKPAKYGMLFKSLNSAGIPYLHRTVVYSSKPEGEANEFYLKGTANYVESLVSGLQKYVKLDGKNISMDRYKMAFGSKCYCYRDPTTQPIRDTKRN